MNISDEGAEARADIRGLADSLAETLLTALIGCVGQMGDEGTDPHLRLRGEARARG